MSIATTKQSNYAKWTLVGLSIIVAAICACFTNSLTEQFVSDDAIIIQLNQDRFDLNTIVRCFTTSDRLWESVPTPYYRPLTRLIFILEQEFFQLDPTGYHIVSISMHALAASLLYLILLRLGCGPLSSLLGSLLFALHPITTEAVDLLAARNNILATVFVLGAYLAFLRGEKLSNNRWHVLSGGLFFCGVLAKETAIMFVPFLLLMTTVLRSTSHKPTSILNRDFGYLLPHVLFLSFYLALRFVAIDQFAPLTELEPFLNKLVYIIPKYLLLLVIPTNQNFNYVLPHNLSSLFWPLFAAWGVLVVIVWYLIKHRTSAITFGIAWLSLNFIPISGVFPIPSSPYADRYFYLPLIGIAVIVADRLSRLPQGTVRRSIFCGVMALIVVLGILTRHRNAVWHDELSLAESVAHKSPDNYDARFDLGEKYFLCGKLDNARSEFKTALELNPTHSLSGWATYYLVVIDLKQPAHGETYRRPINSTAADYIPPVLYFTRGELLRKNSPQEAARSYEQFLNTFSLDSSHLIPEARSAMMTSLGKEFRHEIPPSRPLSAPWKLLRQLPTGTRFYYDSQALNRAPSGNLDVDGRFQLVRKDMVLYLMRIIQFPLSGMAEADIHFEVDCKQRIYKTPQITFLDPDGHVLGKLNLNKEELLHFLSPPDGSIPAELINNVCDGGK